MRLRFVLAVLLSSIAACDGPMKPTPDSDVVDGTPLELDGPKPDQGSIDATLPDALPADQGPEDMARSDSVLEICDGVDNTGEGRVDEGFAFRCGPPFFHFVAYELFLPPCILVLDYSASMQENFGSGTRLSTQIELVETVVASHDSCAVGPFAVPGVPFGVLLADPLSPNNEIEVSAQPDAPLRYEHELEGRRLRFNQAVCERLEAGWSVMVRLQGG